MRRSSLIDCGGAGAGVAGAGERAGAGAAAGRGAAPADGRAVVAEVRRILAERYVLPERRPALDAILAQGLAAGRYDVREPADAGRADQRRSRHRRPRPPPQLQLQSRPGGDAGGRTQREREPDTSAFEREARANNHGVKALRVLPGNVRYLDYDAFLWIGPESAAALETAMRFLAGGDAVIIDLQAQRRRQPRRGPIYDQPLPPRRPAAGHLPHERPAHAGPALDAGRAAGRADGRQAALRADQRRHALRRRRSLPAMSAATGSASWSARRRPARASATSWCRSRAAMC